MATNHPAHSNSGGDPSPHRKRSSSLRWRAVLSRALLNMLAIGLAIGLFSGLSCGELPDGSDGAEIGDDSERGQYPSCYGKSEGALLENLGFVKKTTK